MTPSDYVRYLDGHQYYAQSAQDLFVQYILNGKKDGYYLEIGGSHPYESNNTFLLESNYNWNGISIEYNRELCDKFNAVRSNQCLELDATKADYLNIFSRHRLPHTLDYLSIDIDPAENTFLALTRIPFSQYKFSVITYEHDRYQSGDKYMNLSRDFLLSNGYNLFCKNVHCFGRDYEDWWVHSSLSLNHLATLNLHFLEFEQLMNQLLSVH